MTNLFPTDKAMKSLLVEFKNRKPSYRNLMPSFCDLEELAYNAGCDNIKGHSENHGSVSTNK